MENKWFVWIGILFLSINFLTTNAYSSQENNLVKFITMADIHFDPFIACYREKIHPCPIIQKLRQAPIPQWSSLLAKYDTEPPYYRFNTNYPLLVSSLTSAKKIAAQSNPQFILILGDFIGHDYRESYQQYTNDHSKIGYQSFFNKTMEYLTSELTKTFPNTEIFPVVGNHDSYFGNYVFYANTKFYNQLLTIWTPLMKDQKNRASLASSFSIGGYYAVDIPTHSNLRLIVLNTILFSDKVMGRGINQAALNELDWFHQQLELARLKNQKVIIAMHIPPGIDIYATLKLRLFRLLDLWKLTYTKRFEAELRAFAPEIIGIFTGHLHIDWFQILTLDNFHSIPVSGSPSISPVYGNNPGFKLFTYSLQLQRFIDFETYSYSIDSNRFWERISYENKYHQNLFSLQSSNNANPAISHKLLLEQFTALKAAP
ncbi:MAG: hypothetical protein A3F11_03765 [Gammaproteobacteria bacterium RIFCSPHIGHO2_12_FULL_37_14]|nr:MAG: hypothetical protein A3F11_03765 [Gammaproteobacteria bacterium RIFCSPHIGHO2_12_FULL_37_14]